MKKRIAGIQTNVDFADPSRNLDRMIQWINDDRVAGAHLVVFPECMLTGYCFESAEEALAVAQTIPGPATSSVAEACRSSGCYVAFGMVERDHHSRLFNSCALVGPEGLVAVYRKVHLPYLGVDRFVTRGEEPFAVHEIDGLRVGMHICYDGSFPESSRCLALLGADLLILPTNWPPGADTFAKYLPNARALENHVYFMSVNRVGTERGFTFIGQSRLCDTNGNPISEAPAAGEFVVSGEIDLSIPRNKRLVRVPGKHVIDRFADRCPQYYDPITQKHHLVRDVS